MLVDNQGKNKLPKTDNNLQDAFAKFFLDKIDKKSHSLINSHFYEPPPEIAHFLRIFMK